jgi:hypothetical protein
MQLDLLGFHNRSVQNGIESLPKFTLERAPDFWTHCETPVEFAGYYRDGEINEEQLEVVSSIL